MVPVKARWTPPMLCPSANGRAGWQAEARRAKRVPLAAEQRDLAVGNGRKVRFY